VPLNKQIRKKNVRFSPDSGKLRILYRVGGADHRSPLGTAVFAIQCMRTLGGIDNDDFSFPLRGAEVGRWFAIYNRNDITGTAATGAAFTCIFRNRLETFPEHAKEYFWDPINLVKLL